MTAIDDVKEEIWQWVAAIPPGKVATYGQIARLAGIPNKPRMVGTVLNHLPAGSKLPWFRVINSAGRLSSPSADRQQQHLADEGVHLLNGRINLKLYQWDA